VSHRSKQQAASSEQRESLQFALYFWPLAAQQQAASSEQQQ
jgi:hypothetical protein